MAQATLLPDGMYEVQLDDGSTYTTPEYIARDMAPDSFQDAYDQAASGVGGYAAEAPPWGIEAQSAAPVMDFAPDVIEQPPEMTFSEAEAGPADVFPGSGAEWAAEQGLGAQPQRGPASRSVSAGMSVAGTGPYQEARHSGPPPLPTFAGEMAMMEQGRMQSQGALDAQQAVEAQYAKDTAGLHDQRQQERQQTYEQWGEMHEAASQELAAKEAEIQQQVAQIPRMDPQRIWGNTDNSTKFGGIMAAAVAGWLSPGKPNQVVAQMQALADRDARAQQTDIETAKFQVGVAERAYGRLSDRFAQDEESYLKRRFFLEQGIVHALEAEKQKYQSAINIANIEQMQGAITQESAKTYQQWRQQAYANSQQSWYQQAQIKESQANRRAAAARFRISQRAAAEDRAIKKAQLLSKPDVGDPLYTFDGKTVYAGKEYTGQIGTEERAGIRKALTAERGIHRVGKELLFHLQNKDTRTGRLMPTSAAWIKKHLSEFHLMMRPKTGANFTEPERKDLDAFFGSPEGIIKDPDSASEILKNTLDGSSRRMMEMVSGYNPQLFTGEFDDVDIPGFGKVRRQRVRPMDITESPLPEELSVPELADVVPQHIRKFAEEVGAAAESYQSLQNELENVRVSYEAPREAPVGADPKYTPDLEATGVYRDVQKRLDGKRTQVRLKVRQLMDRLEETGLDKDAAVIDEINAYLTSVEDIIGPQFTSPVAEATEAMEPDYSIPTAEATELGHGAAGYGYRQMLNE